MIRAACPKGATEANQETSVARRANRRSGSDRSEGNLREAFSHLQMFPRLASRMRAAFVDQQRSAVIVPYWRLTQVAMMRVC
jgi:hypothetical protein